MANKAQLIFAHIGKSRKKQDLNFSISISHDLKKAIVYPKDTSKVLVGLGIDLIFEPQTSLIKSMKAERNQR